VNAGTLKRLLLTKMKVHCFSNEQVTPAHLGLWRGILGVGTRGGGLLTGVGHNQKRVGIVERGQNQSVALPWWVGIYG